MKKSDIYIGTVKKCKNVNKYNIVGEYEFIDDFIICSAHLGRMEYYVDIVSDKAILIKVNEDEYVFLDLVNTLKEKILLDLGIAVNVIKTKPYSNYDYFVDESTLKPYFKGNINEDIKVKTLKKTIKNNLN